MKTLAPPLDKYAGSIVDLIALISPTSYRLDEVDTSIHGPGEEKDFLPSEEMDAVRQDSRPYSYIAILFLTVADRCLPLQQWEFLGG